MALAKVPGLLGRSAFQSMLFSQLQFLRGSGSTRYVFHLEKHSGKEGYFTQRNLFPNCMAGEEMSRWCGMTLGCRFLISSNLFLLLWKTLSHGWLAISSIMKMGSRFALLLTNCLLKKKPILSWKSLSVWDQLRINLFGTMIWRVSTMSRAGIRSLALLKTWTIMHLLPEICELACGIEFGFAFLPKFLCGDCCEVSSQPKLLWQSSSLYVTCAFCHDKVENDMHFSTCLSFVVLWSTFGKLVVLTSPKIITGDTLSRIGSLRLVVFL